MSGTLELGDRVEPCLAGHQALLGRVTEFNPDAVAQLEALRAGP
jgi:hypothetical protein